MPILVNKATKVPSFKKVPLEKIGKPWIDDIDFDTGEITWNTTAMNALKTAIRSGVTENDKILTAEGGKLRVAIKKGFIRISVDSDNMPNWHDIRQVVIIHSTATAAVKERVARCPGVVIRQAMLELDQEDRFKRVTPTQVY
jgi:hypothetical protein